MSRGAVVYLVISLPTTITKLNLSGCRDTLQDEGSYIIGMVEDQHIIIIIIIIIINIIIIILHVMAF